jgi:hypothetical protein
MKETRPLGYAHRPGEWWPMRECRRSEAEAIDGNSDSARLIPAAPARQRCG